MKLQQLQNERYKEGVVFMNIKITGKELKATEAIREYVEKKCERLQKYTEEEIEPLSRKWWEYWKDYWCLRGTRDASPKDFACEVTIPVNKEDPQGMW